MSTSAGTGISTTCPEPFASSIGLPFLSRISVSLKVMLPESGHEFEYIAHYKTVFDIDFQIIAIVFQNFTAVLLMVKTG